MSGEAAPLRVCLWAPVPPPLGGISRWTERFCDAAPDYDLDVRVVNIAPPVGAFNERSRLDAGRIPVATRALRELHELIRTERPALVHVTSSLFWATPRDVLTLALCRFHGVPSILQIRASSQTIEWREALDPLRRAGLDATLRMADCVLVLSQELEEYLGSELPGLRVHRIPNMIADSERSEASNGPLLLPEDRSRCRIVFVGQRTPLKGLGELADAVHQLPDCELVVVGPPGGAIDPAMQERMEAAIERLRKTGRLHETGELAPENVTRLYREADVFALATHREGLPNTLLEAMASGLPCVSTPVGAIPEVLEENCGVIVPVGDTDQLREALATLAANPDERQQLALRGRQRIADRYSVDAVMRQYRELYASIAVSG